MLTNNRQIVNTYNLLVVVFVALGTLSTAYGLAIIGSTVGQPSFYTYFNLAPQGQPGYDHTTNIIGALNGVNSAGAIVGCLTSAWSADAFGRKRTLLLGCLILIVGGAICSGSISIGMFIAGRVVAGIGAGILAVCVPMYQGEVSTAETRGAMMCVTGIMYAFGYAWAGWMGFACYFFPSDSPHASFAWRFPLALQCLPPLVVLAGNHFIPFSPRCLLMWGDQFLGIFVMTNYGVLIYAALGLGGFRPLLLNACWTTFTIPGNIWTFFFVDRWGRRTLLLIGSTGCTVSLIFLAALSAEFLDTNNSAGLNAAVFFIWFYIVWWCFCVDATQYVYVSEIWPNHLRSQGTALGIAAFYLGSEVTLVAAPVALDAIGWKFYLVLICPSVCYIAAIWLLFPETKNRTLEEIGTLFGDEHVASHWYGISEEEKQEIARNAMKLTESGGIPEEPRANTSENGKGEMGVDRVEDAGHSV
ncbi:hypothetical protein D0867_02933 [Hortaea werneckii]|uniref:Major facilitator superfamily (MFS) profile domain-containing protein n=1 Tax=Hortaea werneckii TaxID=91943 RepID=A0A3M7A3R1_HORWE|nr:hypothetical protein D0867_02933 [Hortaea werneckii]RMY39417.1 hypothetical protein D0866_01940 [Hortaea werneckii]